MWTSILTIVAGLVSVGVWFFKRWAAKKVKPVEQLAAKEREYARQVVENDEAAANADLQRDLDRLRRAESVRGDQRGQGSPPADYR